MHRRRRCCRHRPGFTILELMVTIGIIVLLLSLLFPVIGKVRRAAYNTDSLNFISVLQNAITRYHQDFNAYPGPLSNQEVSTTIAAGVATYPPPGVFGGTFQVKDSITPANGSTIAGYDTATSPATGGNCSITMAENLTLGLLGGLWVDFSTTPPSLSYDPQTVGRGPLRLSNLANVPHTRSPAYIEATHLSWKDVGGQKTGHYFDDATDDAAHTGCQDSIIPEFVDSFPDPMPILYLRATRGVNGILPNFAGSPAYGNQNNPVITDSRGMTAPNDRLGTYDLVQVLPYTLPNTNAQSIGVNKRISTSDYVPAVTKKPSGNSYTAATPGKAPQPFQHGLQAATPPDNTAAPQSSLDPTSVKFCYPYDAYAYFLDPSQPGNTTTPSAPRQKDGYILISAGIDRVYGTHDDLTNFGDVAP